MLMKKSINLNTWPRASAFKHFSSYSNPYFGITSDVDCTEAYHYAKENALSFFLYYFYLSLQAANEVPEFRMRLEGGKPVIYDTIKGSPTILKDDGELGYAMMEYDEDFNTFYSLAQKEVKRVKSQDHLDTSKDCPDTIYYSVLPWVKFTAVEHPMDIPTTEGVPILTFGKMTDNNGRKIMPLAIHAHHGLMDGLHMAKFIKLFQEKLSKSIAF
mgnify:CR=1 FL=1